MDFDWLDEPAIVEKKKKYANFKVTPIGGPTEIIAWRQRQEAKESLQRIRISEREKRIADVEAQLGQKLTSPTIHTTSWAEKLAFAQSEQSRLKRNEENVTQYPPWESLPEPQPTLIQRITRFFKRIWTDAKF